MDSYTVLLADDDSKIREILSLYLVKENFNVVEAADGAEALVKFQQKKVDLIILDLMMPIVDGLEVCRQIRKFSRIPIIMLTARADDDDKIMGLELGADDYVGKPFSPREVVARAKAVLRRIPSQPAVEKDALFFPDLTISFSKYNVIAFGKSISLTAKEMELLWLMASHPERVYSRDQLLEIVWGYEYCGDTRTIDVHIQRLRQKLAFKNSSPWDIKTVWGVGYKFEVKK